MRFNPKRRGIPFFVDFYKTELRGKPDNPDHAPVIRMIYEHTKKVLLKEVAVCVVGELKYKSHHLMRMGFGYFYTGYHTNKRHRLMICRRNGGIRRTLSLAVHVFEDLDWSVGYGGAAWGEICRRALQLESCPVNHLGNLVVAIDKVIDSSHNNGRCLNKLYPGIDHFLTEKTQIGVDNYEEQPFIRRYLR